MEQLDEMKAMIKDLTSKNKELAAEGGGGADAGTC